MRHIISQTQLKGLCKDTFPPAGFSGRKVTSLLLEAVGSGEETHREQGSFRSWMCG